MRLNRLPRERGLKLNGKQNSGEYYLSNLIISVQLNKRVAK